STRIRFSVASRNGGEGESSEGLLSEQKVTLKVYDVLGKEVATLVNENLNAGNYEMTFDAKRLASGVYFYRLEAGAFSQTKRMLLMR
ncbi:MAG: T9SS type A sorting domain-containing protein, partial [Ignavibacteriae bacterium]|nr:T9SS type A sorting domain-containing protein [Ignavibacteriota bacterium]